MRPALQYNTIQKQYRSISIEVIMKNKKVKNFQKKIQKKFRKFWEKLEKWRKKSDSILKTPCNAVHRRRKRRATPCKAVQRLPRLLTKITAPGVGGGLNK